MAARRQNVASDKRDRVRAALRATVPSDATVASVMTPHPVWVAPEARAGELLHAFESHRIQHLLVVDGGRLVGMLTDRDVVRLFSLADFGNASEMHGVTAETLMGPNPASVSAATTLAEAARKMVDEGVHCLPVVDGERPIGVVTTSDLLLGLEFLADPAVGEPVAP